jgi:hypothetical protein
MISAGTSLKQIQSRILTSLENGLQFDLSTEDCNKFLRRHVNDKVKLAILYIDIHNSTKMSLLLSATNFALMIQIFSQEITLATLFNPRVNLIDINFRITRTIIRMDSSDTTYLLLLLLSWRPPMFRVSSELRIFDYCWWCWQKVFVLSFA